MSEPKEHKVQSSVSFKFTCACGAVFEQEEKKETVVVTGGSNYYTSSSALVAVMTEHGKYCEFKGETDYKEVNQLLTNELVSMNGQ